MVSSPVVDLEEQREVLSRLREIINSVSSDNNSLSLARAVGEGKRIIEDYHLAQWHGKLGDKFREYESFFELRTRQLFSSPNSSAFVSEEFVRGYFSMRGDN